SKAFWVANPIISRRSCWVTCLISSPFISIEPESISYNLKIKLAKVVFPAPVPPIIAIFSPSFKEKSISFKANFSAPGRSEEHTSELQSRFDLVCRLLLEKKKKNKNYVTDRLKDSII